MITEIIVLGRGGQGGVTAAELIAEAAFKAGYKDVASFPTFGTERRGSPVYAYTRIADEKIWTRQQIYNPDIAVVLDETIMSEQFIRSIKPKGILVVNTDKCANDIIQAFSITDDITVATCNVTHHSIENKFIIDGQPMVNTPIMGVLTQVLASISMKSISEAIIERFGGEKAKINIKIAEECSESSDIRMGGK